MCCSATSNFGGPPEASWISRRRRVFDKLVLGTAKKNFGVKIQSFYFEIIWGLTKIWGLSITSQYCGGWSKSGLYCFLGSCKVKMLDWLFSGCCWWFSDALKVLIRWFKSLLILESLATQEQSPHMKKKKRTKSKLVLQSSSNDMVAAKKSDSILVRLRAKALYWLVL